MRSFFSAVFTAVFSMALGCSSDQDARRALEPGDGSKDPDGGAVADTGARRLVGRWRMIGEEPADGLGPIFGQERRLLDLRSDGTYHVENYISAWDDAWTVDGDVLTLRRVREVGGELGIARQRIDETARVKVERVDAVSLVLIEDLPEIYLREGPRRKVRNTYRKVSEAELGPMIGAAVRASPPSSGLWQGAYEYSMSKYPTMEIHVAKGIRGRARLELLADGSAAGCFGVASDESFSRSEYATDDGEPRLERGRVRSLFFARGRWVVEGEKGLVRMDRFWRDTCAPAGGEGEIMGPLELECVEIAPTDRLPVRALGCVLAKHHGHLDELAVNPADTERAGPYTLQLEPMGRISTDPGRPWLFLGSEPGLWVRSEDDRDTKSPKVAFIAGAAPFVEDDYRDSPK